MSETVTAHEMAADPFYWGFAVKIGRNEWECMGYARTGRTVRFARLVEVDNKKLKQVNIYVAPYKEVEIVGVIV